MRVKLTAAQKKSLLRDGYAVVRGLVPPKLTAPAVREINNRLGTGVAPNMDGYADAHDYQSEHLRTNAVMNLAKGGLQDLAESLLGAGKIEPLSQGQVVLRFPSENDAVRYKPLIHIDGLAAASPGRDGGAGKPQRYSFCAGVFLSDAPKPGMGGLRVFPGTHLQIARLIEKRGLAALKDGIESLIDLPEPVEVLGKTGDVVLFHFQLMHERGRNDSPFIRRACYFRFWHVDSWHDASPAYLERAMRDPWLEWPGLRGGA